MGVGYGKISRRCGEYAFWSPDRFAGSYDEKDDLYALGALIYELVTGGPPLFGFGEVRELSYKSLAPLIYRRVVRFERSEWHSITPQLVDFVAKLLEIESKLRMSAHDSLNHGWIRTYREKAKLQK